MPRGRALEDLSGKPFGRLTPLEPIGRNRWRSVLWRCLCTCGSETVVAAGDLKKGATSSCGCLHNEQLSARRRTHGQTGSPEYVVWTNMKSRCHTPTATGYEYYGARGIRVCARWLESFENFLNDMGKRPSEKHTIERKNNDRGYSPENCIWATWHEQRMNQRPRAKRGKGPA